MSGSTPANPVSNAVPDKQKERRAMSDTIETYREVKILVDKILGGVTGPRKTVRYVCTAHTQTIHDDSLDGIKRKIDAVIDKPSN